MWWRLPGKEGSHLLLFVEFDLTQVSTRPRITIIFPSGRLSSSLPCLINRCKSDIIAVMHIDTITSPPESDNDGGHLNKKPANIPLRPICVVIRLVDLQQLQVKGKLRIGRYPCYSLLAVCEICRDGDPTLTTRLHTCNTNIPTFDD